MIDSFDIKVMIKFNGIMLLVMNGVVIVVFNVVVVSIDRIIMVEFCVLLLLDVIIVWKKFIGLCNLKFKFMGINRIVSRVVFVEFIIVNISNVMVLVNERVELKKIICFVLNCFVSLFVIFVLMMKKVIFDICIIIKLVSVLFKDEIIIIGVLNINISRVLREKVWFKVYCRQVGLVRRCRQLLDVFVFFFVLFCVGRFFFSF